MAESVPQTYASHRRWDPSYHYFASGVLAVNFLLQVWFFIRSPGLMTLWGILMAAAFVVLLFKLRVYPLRAQDRVIRLEETLRLQRLLAEPLRARIGELTVRQLVGLRFASDGEVPALVERALAEKLPEEEIKKAVTSWRADTYRV